ncbi:hypothetical protein [Streptomyces griseorubiginosus]|uniref:hypothetical protein n=1 Tax=Streptomyces griseorubiginosus TaxID=67304 RepID=UPI0036E98430
MELGPDRGQSAPDLWLPRARRALLGDTRHWAHPRDTPAALQPNAGSRSPGSPATPT